MGGYSHQNEEGAIKMKSCSEKAFDLKVGLHNGGEIGLGKDALIIRLNNNFKIITPVQKQKKQTKQWYEIRQFDEKGLEVLVSYETAEEQYSEVEKLLKERVK